MDRLVAGAPRLDSVAARASLRRRLLAWYGAHRRPLPWRRDRDSYRVWVAEVMLQQTRVETVVPRYGEFLAAFPDLTALAAASEDEVLARWSGLGYYTRARGLHRAARALASRGEREFPHELALARALPGVGEYIAAAVLSIAYGLPAAAVEANVVRVLSRLARLGLPGRLGEPHRSLADRLLARSRPGDWNQALMELGQTVCLPRAPRCTACPLADRCAAHREGAVALHPPPRPRRLPERLRLELRLVVDPRGDLLLERGAFAFLKHLWLPPVRVANDDVRASRRKRTAAAAARDDGRVAPRDPPSLLGSFRHSILHRTFDVEVRRAALTRRERERLLRERTADGVERRFFSIAELARIGRSALLAKAMQLDERLARSARGASGRRARRVVRGGAVRARARASRRARGQARR